MRRIPALLALAALAVTGCAGAASEPGSVACGGVDGDVVVSREPLATLTSGQPLPSAELAELHSGACTTLQDLVGTPMVVNVWATWCAFCVEEMPDLQAASERLEGKVQFVGLNREDNAAQARALARETGVEYLLLEDPKGDYFFSLKARAMPTTVLVDANGVIQYRHAGSLTEDQLLDLVVEHLGVRV